MRHNMIRFFTLLLVLTLVFSCALPVFAADIDLGVTVSGTNPITVTVDNSEGTNAVLAATPAKLEVSCSFDAAYVEFENKILAGTSLNTAEHKITFPVAKGGTYTIHNGAPAKITFNSNGGSAVSSQTIVPGGKVEKPADPTKDGCFFDGWYSSETFTAATEWDFANNTAATSMTLYAKWNEGIRITFNSNGGSTVDSQTILPGSNATQPADPTRAGYTFAGWYADDKLTTAWDFDTAVTENKTLYAKWNENPLSGITVTPAAITLFQGDTKTFIATTQGTNPTGTTITWAVSGQNDTNTKISTTGLLVIGSKETAKTLTVTGTATLDSNVFSDTAEVTVLPVYDFHSADGKRWAKDSTRSLIFDLDVPYEQPKVTKVIVNGEEVDSSYYEVSKEDGDTRIALKRSFLRHLRVSQYPYELTVLFDDGGIAETWFYVIRSSGLANTGDLFNMTLWGSLLGISSLCVLILVIVKKRKK